MGLFEWQSQNGMCGWYDRYQSDQSLPTTLVFDSQEHLSFFEMAQTEVINLDDYTAILLSHEVDYRSTRGVARQKILQEIMQEMVALSEGSLNEDGMKGLYKVSQPIQTSDSEISPIWTQRIPVWYGNHKTVQLEDEFTLVRVGTLWNYRLVIQHLFKDTIATQMEEHHLTPSDPNWLQQYQWTVNSVIKSLGSGDETIQKYTVVAKSWNEAGLPDELRRK